MDRKTKSGETVRRRRRGAGKKQKKTTVIAVSILALAIICVSCYFAFFKKDNNVSASEIYVGDINVGGKDLEHIKESLEVLNGAFDDSSVEVNVEGSGETKTVKAADIELKFNLDKTAQEAFDAGKKSGMLERRKRIDVGYSFDYNELLLRSFVDELTKGAGGDLKEHEIITEDTRVVIKSGKSGKGVSTDDAVNTIVKSFKPHENTKTEVKMHQSSPKDIDINELYNATKTEVCDAQYKYENNNVVVTDETDGKEIDKEDAKKKLEGFKEGSDDVYIDFKITPATVKKQQLQSRLFRDVLGEYSSKYQASNVNRTANVELAAKYINGTILMPGDVFSYNSAVGPRTAERGFRVASVYEANRVADGMGGGICQTCSTLYPAVLYADLEVVERYNHSLEVSYVPLGMDATVAWNSLDFKFKNSTSSPVKIVTSYGKGTVYVKLIGTKENTGRSIKIVTERTSYTPFTVKEVVDETLAPGSRVNESNGFNGSTVNTYKVYYENGAEVKRVNLGRSVYRMAEKVVRVGPEAVNSGAPATDVPANTGEPAPVSPSPTPVQTPESTPESPEQNPITDEQILEEYPEGI